MGGNLGIGTAIPNQYYNGQTCFLEAARFGKLEILKYLNSNYPHLKYGRDEDGKTALDLAREENWSDIVAYLENL